MGTRIPPTADLKQGYAGSGRGSTARKHPRQVHGNALSKASLEQGGLTLILRTESDQVIVTLQTDHARLSGVFARAWGNGRVARPEPYDTACAAADHHDDGWYEWERAPQVNPATGHPYNFTAMPLQVHLALYRQGIDRVRALDPYAGLLVSLHIVRLYRPRAAGSGHEANIIAAFIRDQEGEQAAWRDALCPPGPVRAAFDRQVHVNHRLLAFWDRLSLVFGLHGLAELDGGVTVPRLPLSYDGNEEHATATHLGGGRVRLDPYPFDRDPLLCILPVRAIPNRRFPDDAALHAALAAAPLEAIAFSLTAGEHPAP